MLYLAIDQHAKQITVCVRNEDGDTVLRRQVSTRHEKIQAFFSAVHRDGCPVHGNSGSLWFQRLVDSKSSENGAAVRSCSFHPERPSKKKTDRRDAHKLADLLWINRERLAAGQTVHGLRRVYLVTQKEREDPQLTALRKTLGQRRTRTLNKIHRIINRHNMIWNYPDQVFSNSGWPSLAGKTRAAGNRSTRNGYAAGGMEDVG